jgi:hypothetical protein
MSKGTHADSQAITSVGVITGLHLTQNHNQLAQITAGRSAYTDQQLRVLAAHNPVRAIDFLLVGHLEQRIPRSDLLANGILNGSPQSVTKIRPQSYAALKHLLNLGFPI